MPSPPLLPALLSELDHLTDGLIGGQLTAVDWHNAVARELFAHHLAAYASAARIDERAALAKVKKVVARQVEYLGKFTDEIEAGSYKDREAGLRARAVLYAGSIKESHFRGLAGDRELPAYPGDGSSECLGSCGCEWEFDGGVAYWRRGNDDSCPTCIERAGAWAPYREG